MVEEGSSWNTLDVSAIIEFPAEKGVTGNNILALNYIDRDMHPVVKKVIAAIACASYKQHVHSLHCLLRNSFKLLLAR
jgi:hypothetical protein